MNDTEMVCPPGPHNVTQCAWPTPQQAHERITANPRARDLQEAAMTDGCYRCADEPAGRIDPLEPDPGLCRPCLDEVSHAAENRHIEGAWHQLGDDNTDGGRWIA